MRIKLENGYDAELDMSKPNEIVLRFYTPNYLASVPIKGDEPETIAFIKAFAKSHGIDLNAERR